jgi:hypothetical protein
MTVRWSMTEEQLLAEVAARCERRGIWWVHIDAPHHNRRRQNLVGFPDLLLCGPGGIAFRELKSGAYGARLRSEQTAWKYRLKAARQDWALWKPADLESGRIDRELDALARPTQADQHTGET